VGHVIVQNQAFGAALMSLLQRVGVPPGPALAHWPPPELQYPPTPCALFAVPGFTQLLGLSMTSMVASTPPPPVSSPPPSLPVPALLELEELHPAATPKAVAMERITERPARKDTTLFSTARILARTRNCIQTGN
jgi:hypothetical protein